MELYLDDMFNILEDTPDKSVDFIYCDLPYNETACKFDKEVIDLDKLWFHYKRIAKNDETPFMFSCSVKFGNKLINSNPKWFRYEFLWIKSSPTGFLNARRLPMRKSEMVYVFYKKLPKVYGENLNLHHTHKFLKETSSNNTGKEVIYDRKCKRDMYGDINRDNRKNRIIYNPPCPTNVVSEELCKYDVDKNVYGGGKKDRIKISKNKEDHMTKYEPPLPNNVIVEEKIKIYKSDSEMYGKIDRPDSRKNRKKGDESVYQPPLPTNIINENDDKVVNYKTLYGDVDIIEPSERKNGEPRYEPPLPNNVIVEEQKTFKRGKNKKTNEDAYNYDERVNNGKLYHHDRSLQKGSEPIYDPPLPTNVLEIKSEKKLHPTQKPVALIEFLLKYYSRENDLCLDVCMGSGTTGIACLNMNRRFIGIEKDEKFFAIAMERIEKHPNYKSTTSS